MEISEVEPTATDLLKRIQTVEYEVQNSKFAYEGLQHKLDTNRQYLYMAAAFYLGYVFCVRMMKIAGSE